MRFNSEFKIGKDIVGVNYPTYFIADIAANHDGNLNRAKELIKLAKAAGANCAKFQHFLPDKIVSDYGFKHLTTGQSHQAKWEKSVYDIYDEYHCRREWNAELVETCKKEDIEFMTTPYDYSAVDEIDKYVNAYKVGSGDITWIEFIEYISKLNKPIMLATGASSLDDVSRAMDIICKYNSNVVLMQCNTNYTADIENFKYINLNVLKKYSELYNGVVLGLSDHTLGHATVLGAVALGARVVEKHFTDDNTRKGPDHRFAMNPITWKDMVERTRELELSLGDGVKRVEGNEKDTVIIQRRSIRLNCDKKVNDIINFKDLDFLRPAPLNAYVPYEVNLVVGKRLLKDKAKGDCIYKGDFCE